MLPAPQVADSELEELVKIGYSGESAKMAVSEATPATSFLNEYAATPISSSNFRTPKVNAGEDILKIEARNLRKMEQSQTPLLGEVLDVELESGTGYTGVTPRRTSGTTPNNLVNSVYGAMTPRGGSSSAGTPRTNYSGSVVGTPRSMYGGGSTPSVRDQMGINSATGNDWESSVAGTPRGSMTNGGGAGPVGRTGLIRGQLGNLFKSLPKPKNDFEIVVPEKSTAGHQDGDVEDLASEMTDMDMADVIKMKEAQVQAENARRLSRRSMAVQKDLPRPFVVDVSRITRVEKGDDAVDALVKQEMARLMLHDAKEYPYPGQAHPMNGEDLEDIDPAYLNEACHLLDTECKPTAEFSRAFEIAYISKIQTQVYVQSLDAHITLASLPGMEAITHLNKSFSSARSTLTSDSKKAAKLEKKLNLILNGYKSRCDTFRSQIANKSDALQSLDIKTKSFEALKAIEDANIPARMERAMADFETVTKTEELLQERYGELLRRKEELVQALKS